MLCPRHFPCLPLIPAQWTTQVTHKIMSEISDCSLKSSSFGVICYTAIDNWYTLTISNILPLHSPSNGRNHPEGIELQVQPSYWDPREKISWSNRWAERFPYELWIPSHHLFSAWLSLEVDGTLFFTKLVFTDLLLAGCSWFLFLLLLHLAQSNEPILTPLFSSTALINLLSKTDPFVCLDPW